MKILIGGFIAECNVYSNKIARIQDFNIVEGEDVVDHLAIRKIAEENNIELISSIWASAGGTGIVSEDSFDYILKQFKRYIRENDGKFDGMFFFFHGASYVENLEGFSGDHALMREIRKMVGPYIPIAVTCDPHGNISQEHADNCTILRTFRHSPHTDRNEALQITFKALVNVVKNRREIHEVYRKVPILLGGERCVSTDEPLVSINKLLNEIESDPRILSCSYHIGYLRHDSDKCGAGIIVVPNGPEDEEYAKQKAQEIYDFVWARHKEFHFTGYADEPDIALNEMLKFNGTPCFLTDSGDNVTAGAPGENTFVLKQVLGLKEFNNKNILFAMIVDKQLVVSYFKNKKINDHVEFEIGGPNNWFKEKVKLSGTLISIGDLHHHYHETKVVGTGYTIKLDEIPVTVVVGDQAISFAERIQYEWCNVNLDAYDLIIVKQGYLYPELKAMAKHYVMSLTDGACMQRTEKLPYKYVSRPIYPLDNI